MLYPMKTLLLDAKKKKYAVGAFNAISMDQIHNVISCAEDLSSPLIVQIAEVHFPYTQFDQLVDYVEYRIAKSSIPIALHLDHGEKFNTVLRCIHKGFTSVMFDGSGLSYEDNVLKTKEIVSICTPINITVEAELGHVGSEGMEGGEGGIANKDFFTDPEQVEDFVARTDIDALAIAFGNVHGKYKGTPNLNWGLLKDIANRVDIPLVLHGGSGISDDDFKKAISLGICKINFFSGMEEKILEIYHSEDEFPHALGNKNLLYNNAIKDIIGRHIKIFGSSQQC